MIAIFLAFFVALAHGEYAAPAVAVVNTGRSAQYRSQDNVGNYAFGYDEEHAEGGSFRRESGNAYGQVVGSYGLRDADGRLRIVNYVADDDGFRADIKTNEPGVEPKDSASATVNKPTVSVVSQSLSPSAAAVHTVVSQAPAAIVAAAPAVHAPVLAAAPVAYGKASAPIVQSQILSPAHAAKVYTQTNYGTAVSHSAPIVQAPIVQEPVAQVHEAPFYQDPLVQAPIVQEPVAQVPIVQEPVVQAPIVQEPIAQAPIVQAPFYPEQIVQTKTPIVAAASPIVQSYAPAAVRAPIYQSTARYTAPLPIAYKSPVQYVAPLAVKKYAAPIAQVHYAEPIRQVYQTVAAPLVATRKVISAPQYIQRVTYQPTSTLVKSSPLLATAAQSELELAHTYAHPAAYGYTLGMPSSFGYTYIVRKKK